MSCEKDRIWPEVSVVIRTFNRGDTIGAAITSILSQSYAPLQLLVIDDGSTDGTQDLLAESAWPIEYHFQENAGLAAGRERGLALSRGELLIYVDADDRWLPGALHRLATAIELTGADFVFSEWAYPDSRSPDYFLCNHPYFRDLEVSLSPEGFFHFPHELAKRLFLRHQHAVPTGTLFRKRSLTRGFNTTAKVSDDWVAALDAILHHNGSCAYISDPLWEKGVDGRNIFDGSSDFFRAIDFELFDLIWIQERFRSCLTRRELSLLRKRLSQVYLDRSWAYRERFGDRASAIKDAFLSFATYPSFSAVHHFIGNALRF